MHLSSIQRRRWQFCLAMMLTQLNKPVRLMWVHPIYQNREEHGEYFTLYREYHQYDDKFFGWYRMSVKKFDELFEILELSLRKKGCNFREPVCAEEMLVLTIM